MFLNIYSFESEEPVSFMENRKDMINALDRCSWPIREQDIIRLEDEIKQGCTYIQQAKSLREMAENGGKSDDEGGLTSDDQYNKKLFKSKPPRKNKKKNRLSLRYASKPARKVVEPVVKDMSSDEENDAMSQQSDGLSVQSDGSKHSARSMNSDASKHSARSQGSQRSQRSTRSDQEGYKLKVTHETSQDGVKSVRRTSEVVMQNKQEFEVSHC